MDTMDKHLLTFLLLFGSGVVAELQLEPLNAAALLGSNVSFNASVTGPWKIMTWDVDKLLVLTINRDSEYISYQPRYTARNISTDDTSAWEFSIVGVSWKDSGAVICTIQGSIGSRTAQLSVQEQGTVDIVSGNLTVKQDEEAEFRCETSGWFPEPAVSWWLNGVAVNDSLYNTTSQAQGTHFKSTSVLTVRAVRDATVQCRVYLPAATITDSVYLVVVPKPTDWTVLIAVVVAFGSAALLALLIILIVFCCWRKKEKESIEQNERRQGRTESGGVAVQPRRGTLNVGFTMDDRTNETPNADSDFSQRNSLGIYQIPPVDNQTQTSENGYTNFYNPPEFRKHRHVTIV